MHQLVDGRGRPLVIALTPGRAGDSTMLRPLLAQLAVKRLGPGRPRTRPGAVLGDKAYSSRGNRAMLRERKIATVIPQPSDQIAHRQRRGSAGGRPPAFDAAIYKGRNVVERSSTTTSNGAASPPGTTSSPPTTEEPSSYEPSRSGSQLRRRALVAWPEDKRRHGPSGHVALRVTKARLSAANSPGARVVPAIFQDAGLAF